MKISCPFHSPDRHPSCSINLETGMWICYKGCGSGDWMDFVERLRPYTEYAPLQPTTNGHTTEKPVLKSLLDRGFTRTILDKWDILWDAVVGAMCLPLYDATGALQGKIWRFPVGVEPKYRYDVGFRRSETLYGLWKLPTQLTMLVLVEGPLDAIWVREAGIPALAILGSSMSEIQAQIVYKLHSPRVVLCFDNDEAGRKADHNAVELLREQGCWVYRAKLPIGKKDIQEVPHGRVMPLLSHAELCVNSKGMLHPKFRRWYGNSQPSNGRGVWKS